jgi:hypothetical protein
LLLLSLPSPIFAQVDISAQLQGSVVDQSGSVIPGAQLVATDQATALQYTATSDERGNYLFRSLPAGTYTVSCEHPGFTKYVSAGNVILPQKVFTLNVALRVGAVTQTVNVEATAAMVDTVTSTIQTGYQETLMTAIPVIGRDPRDTLELLVPGAQPAGLGQSSSVPITQFNGVSGLTNNYRVDGSDANRYMNGVSNTLPQVENLAEFNVTSSAPDASYGRAAGGQISAITKSGTNQLHGQGWAYLQNGAWNSNSWSNNWLGVKKPAFNQQWYGGNVGGPVYIPKLYNGKDKTFFFGSYERSSTSVATVSTGETITPAERNGDFTNSPDGIPVINGVPTPVISPTQFSTLGKTIMNRTDIMPNPTSGLDTFTWTPPTTTVIQNTLIKIDENIGEKHRLFGSLWWAKNVSSSPDMFYDFGFGSWASHYPNKNLNWTFPNKTQVWTVNDTYSISPTVMNNFILSVTRKLGGEQNTAAANPLFGDADVGVNGIGDVGSADIDQITTPRYMGEGIYQGFWDQNTENTIYATDNVIISHGRHTIKTGFEFRQYHESFLQGWNSGLIIGFADGNQSLGGTGNGIADMMLGLAATMSQDSTENLQDDYPSREAYFQDSIKVTRRLTALLGLRWEPHFGVREENDHRMAWREGQTSTIFPLAPTGVVAIGDQGIPKSTYPDRWGDVGPRISIVYDLFGNGKVAIRSGFAVMSDYQYMQAFNEFGTSFPYGLSLSIAPGSLASLQNPYAAYEAATGTVPFPYQEPGPTSPGNATLKFPNLLNTIGLDEHYNSASIYQWNATFEYQPTKALLLSLGYVATRGTHLPDRYDMNWPRFVPGASAYTTDNVNSRRPWFSDGGLQTMDVAFTDANSMYNSLQFSFRQRASHGLTFMGNYTMSSLAQLQPGAINNNPNPTNSSGDGSAALGLPARYLGDRQLDYFSPGIMHNFALAFSYDIPVPTGNSRLAKSLIGGWTFGGDIIGSSGQYGNVGDVNCNEFNYGSASCYATLVGGSPYATNKGQPLLAGGAQVGVTWLNPAKFLRADEVLVNNVPTVSAGVGQRLYLGNAVQGVFKGPAEFYPNASLSKTFKLTESLKLNWRVEATNVLNHRVLTLPSNTTVGPNMTQFGAITTAMAPRTVQMSGHFIF